MTETLFIWVLSGAYILAAGGYGWAWLLYDRISTRLHDLITNHLKHLENRLKALEDKTNIP